MTAHFKINYLQFQILVLNIVNITRSINLVKNKYEDVLYKENILKQCVTKYLLFGFESTKMDYKFIYPTNAFWQDFAKFWAQKAIKVILDCMV